MDICEAFDVFFCLVLFETLFEFSMKICEISVKKEVDTGYKS